MANTELYVDEEICASARSGLRSRARKDHLPINLDLSGVSSGCFACRADGGIGWVRNEVTPDGLLVRCDGCSQEEGFVVRVNSRVIVPVKPATLKGFTR